jgi:transposase-like protein
MLVELRLVDQRYQAVSEVLNDGATVVDVALRCGVARQTVHGWLPSYAASGSAGWADRSSRRCPVRISKAMGPREVKGWVERTGGTASA